jgi:ABC-type multidrug transport system fused ATPase/permease subunit
MGKVSIGVPIKYALLVAIINIVIIALGRLIEQSRQKLNYGTEIIFTQMLFEAIGKLDQEQIDDEKVQSRITVAEREFWALRELSGSLITLISVVAGYATALIVITRFSPIIAVALLVLTPLLIWLNIAKNVIEKANWDDTSNLWRLRYNTRYALFDTYNFFEYILLGSRQRLRDFWQSLQTKINTKELGVARKVATLDFVENASREFVGVASKIWAIILVSRSVLNFDQFLFTVGLIEQAVTATWRVSFEFRSLHEGVLAGQAGMELLEIAPKREKGVEQLTDTDEGLAIEFQNVSFAYPQNKQTVLADISTTINAGEHIAIVGENGAGKSTFLKLMLGQYEPTSGAVLLQDKAIDSYDKNGLYKHISVLVQNFSLFSFMTVRENMQAVNPRKLSENEIDDALELAGIKTLVHDLPKGLDTRMDRTYDDGTEFSGGQQQRLAIARSFAKKASLLILDEPTSAIDAKAEKKIFETIFERHAKATVIIVSHRFSTVKKADRIIVLHGGKILEQGTHKELMETQGHYAELYNLQAQEYKD